MYVIANSVTVSLVLLCPRAGTNPSSVRYASNLSLMGQHAILLLAGHRESHVQSYTLGVWVEAVAVVQMM
jgi:hypothetical protein